jgi:putative addiction module component (TIGR02574 family)
MAMELTVDEIAQAALSLSVDDREELMCRIVASLGPPPGVLGEDDPGYAAELDRRVDEYNAGKSSAEEWSVVRSRLESLVDGHRRDRSQ